MNGGKHHELQPKQHVMFIVSTSKEHAFMECSLISGLHAIVVH